MEFARFSLLKQELARDTVYPFGTYTFSLYGIQKNGVWVFLAELPGLYKYTESGYTGNTIYRNDVAAFDALRNMIMDVLSDNQKLMLKATIPETILISSPGEWADE